jgi:hypothetical protein
MSRLKKWGLLGLLFLLVGAVRLPWEQRLHEHLLATGVRAAPLANLGLREQLGQNGYLALLGGFRSLVASIVDLLAREEWENVNYGKVESYYRLAQQLQPEVYYYWDTGGWMLARNAAFYYEHRNEERPELGREIAQTWVRKGLAMYQEATERLPNQWRLWDQIGRLYISGVVPPDYAAAAEAYGRAAAQPDTPPYMARFAAYALAQVPGRQREAYAALMACYSADVQRRLKPESIASLIGWIKTLEEELAIPVATRIPQPWPEHFERKEKWPDGRPRQPLAP